jgi:hypothetical protein
MRDLATSPGAAVSPRSGPSAVTLGDFFEPAWQKVTVAAASVVGRRRQRFAPGGPGSWFLRPSAQTPARPCAVPPLPDGDLVAELFPPWSGRSDPATGDGHFARRWVRCRIVPPLSLGGRRR